MVDTSGQGAIISARQLLKQFKIYYKPPGMWGALRTLWHRQQHLKQAVREFDFTVQRPEIIGLLGPNGAGKTTLMKMFTGIIVPSAGELQVLGHVPARREKAYQKQVALVMGQKSQLWWDIPAMDSLLLLQKYYEVSRRDFQERLDELTTLLDVQQLLHIHVRRLSLGERMKLELLASLLHKPKIIFLDEPTIGLDVVAQKNIRAFLLRYHKLHQTTMILTSHYMADVEAMCSRLVLVLEGKKAFDGTIGAFEKILGSEKFLSFNFQTPVQQQDALWAPWGPRWGSDGLSVELRVPQEELRSLAQAVLARFPVVDMSTQKMPIERVLDELMRDPQLLGRQGHPQSGGESERN